MDALFHSNLATKDAREKALILGQLTGHETSNVLAARHDDKRENKVRSRPFNLPPFLPQLLILIFLLPQGTERRFEYA